MLCLNLAVFEFRLHASVEQVWDEKNLAPLAFLAALSVGKFCA
jgi:hypothetical protein